MCAQSCLTLWDSMDRRLPGSSSMECSRKKYWRRLPFPSPGDHHDSGIEPASPQLAGRFFTTEPPGEKVDENVLVYFFMIFYIKLFQNKKFKMKE